MREMRANRHRTFSIAHHPMLVRDWIERLLRVGTGRAGSGTRIQNAALRGRFHVSRSGSRRLYRPEGRGNASASWGRQHGVTVQEHGQRGEAADRLWREMKRSVAEQRATIRA